MLTLCKWIKSYACTFIYYIYMDQVICNYTYVDSMQMDKVICECTYDVISSM